MRNEVPGLNDLSHKMLVCLLKGNGELYYPYKTLESDTGYSREEIKKMIDVFKQLGIVDYARGLMTEDGEVAGSGFGIPWGDPYRRAELAVYKYRYGDLDEVTPPLPHNLKINGYVYELAKQTKD